MPLRLCALIWLLLLPGGAASRAMLGPKSLMWDCVCGFEGWDWRSGGGVCISRWGIWSLIDVFLLVQEEGLTRPAAVTVKKYLNQGIYKRLQTQVHLIRTYRGSQLRHPPLEAQQRPRTPWSVHSERRSPGRPGKARITLSFIFELE